MSKKSGCRHGACTFFVAIDERSNNFYNFFVTNRPENGYIDVTKQKKQQKEAKFLPAYGRAFSFGKQGDLRMETLYRENVKIVSHYLFSMCGDEELVKDLTQETFLKAYESLERFDGSCKISTWLCQIAKHLLYQYWAKAGRQVPMEPDETKPAKEDTENTVLKRVELIDCLKELQKLPEQMREVMYLRVMSDLSYREIGEIMGKSENWARVNFYRAKELLLKGCGRDE